MSIRWTNSSVLRLGVEDPIAYLTERSRQVVLNAIEEGWIGPPYDPIDLARRLGLTVEPREDVVDARIVATGTKPLRIEFNPGQSPGRIRFSIAHEIAHSFFPDCSDRTRYREKGTTTDPDAWQLEMLCNLAAAELVMPIGSFSNLGSRVLSVDELMGLRRQFDVSVEAIMIRFTKLASHPMLLVGSSRIESGADEGRYRVDYSIPSGSWQRIPRAGSLLPEGTCAAECTAIAFTAKATEVWQKLGRVRVESVGAPPYRDSRFPRALCIVSDEDEQSTHSPRVTEVTGDALAPRGAGNRLLVQVVNDRSETWGGGFARAVAAKYPDVQQAFRAWRRAHRGSNLLGEVHRFGGPLLTVASIVAQKGFGASSAPRISYPALKIGLGTVSQIARELGATVHMPKIGSGQAGGNWEVVREMVQSEVASHGTSVTVYSLPSSGHRG